MTRSKVIGAALSSHDTHVISICSRSMFHISQNINEKVPRGVPAHLQLKLNHAICTQSKQFP